MQMTQRVVRITLLALAVASAAIRSEIPAVAQAARWAPDMAAFTAQDQKGLRAGGVVFVGSSSIRLWNLSRSFPAMPVINRGFGGSQVIDSVNHVDLLVIRHNAHRHLLRGRQRPGRRQDAAAGPGRLQGVHGEGPRGAARDAGGIHRHQAEHPAVGADREGPPGECTRPRGLRPRGSPRLH